ncbi:MAG: hypothetical protein MZV63_23575 [Marinilabiliales bacterium]|nr:hypothetical protein [Marinilabiliales bacterium]
MHARCLPGLRRTPLQSAPSPAALNDFKPPPSNQPGKQYPQVNSEGRVRARVVAPQAQSVVLEFIGGVKYPLTKGDDGAWIGDHAAPGRRVPLLPARDRRRRGPGSRQPVLLRRQPLGQRRRSPRQGPGLLRPQERAARPVARDALLLQERQRDSPLLRLHAAGLRQGPDQALSRCCICNTAAAKTRPAGAARARPA